MKTVASHSAHDPVVGRIGVLAAALGVGVSLGILGSSMGCGLAAADTGAGSAAAAGTGAEAGSPATEQPSQRASAGPRSHRAASRTSAGNRGAGPAGARPAAAASYQAGPASASPRISTPTASRSLRLPERSVQAPAPAAAASTAAIPATSVTPAAPAAALTLKAAASAPQAAALPAAAPAASAPLRSLLAKVLTALSGTPGGTVESPIAWFVAAVSRRFGRPPVATAPVAPVTAAAATTGTPTTITWAWGTNPVLTFNPATDKLDFGWMQATQFDVTEKSGSTQIAVVGNNHTYTLQGVPVGQLTMSNIVAKDASTVAKWQNLIAAAQGTATPTVSIASATAAEGNSVSAPMAFTVSLSKASTGTVTVGYATANGTATAGSDYTAASGTLTFAPGVTSQKVSVSVIGDTTVEPDETFTVSLTKPTGATLGVASATGTITNDDVAPAAPSLSIANSTVAEGNTGSANLAFTVSLSKAATNTVTVGYATANGTATAGQDYTATSGTLTFAPGVTTQKVNVAVAGDTAVEPDETLTVTLSAPTGATMTTATATGTILNDDTAAPGPTPTPTPGTAQWGNAFFAPYVDMGGWPVPDLLKLTQTNGGSLFTAAFMQATPDGKLAWAGLSALEPSAANDQAQAINTSIKALKSAGGDVMISLGGQAGTSLAQWYSTHGKTAQQLADAYAGVLNTYGVNHIDFDIEGAAVADPTSVALNSQALKLLQQAKPDVQVWYTLPVLPTGLTADGLNVVKSALGAGVTLAGVNVMAMDYGESAAPTSGPNAKTMGAYAIQAAQSTYSQLSSLYSGYGQTFSWKQIGVTPMLGVNDITSEVFTTADAQALEDFARSKGLGMLAMWSATRDVPGTLGQSTPTTSGLSAAAGSFSKVFNDYGAINKLNYGTSGSGSGSGSGNPVQGGTTTPITWSWGTNTALNFNTATDKLDFGWFQPTNFDIAEKSGSTTITVVGNNQTYTLSGVPLASMSINNIIALDANTVTKWRNAIAAATTI